MSMCCKARMSTDVPATKTLHSTTFATVARFELALDCGLRLRSEEAELVSSVPFFNDLPKLSSDPRGILTVARVRGAPWHTTMIEDAAFYGNFELLRWLHRSGCTWRPLYASSNIIRSSQSPEKRLSTLQWLQQESGARWNQTLKDMLLFEACAFGALAIAEHLLHDGAEWPPALYGFVDKDDLIAFPVRVVKWAIGKGCTWGSWRCQELAPERFSVERRAVAERLFKWAHSGGTECPCTCAAAAVQAQQ